MFLNGVNPIGPCFFDFADIERAQPLWILGTPQECSESEMGVVCFCPIVGEVATSPVVIAAFFFDMPPNALIMCPWGGLVYLRSQCVE